MEASSASSQQQQQHLFPGHAPAQDFASFGSRNWPPEWSNGVRRDMEHLDCAKFDDVARLRGGGAGSPVKMNGIFGNASLQDLFNAKLNLSEPLVEAENDELFSSMEELESHAIGKLLPDDEDDLLAEITSYGRGCSNLEEEFDLFNSGGGLELDGDLQNGLGGYVNSGAAGNAAAILAGEHPYGEHPSRTLFVRNINSNVEDLELRALFEQYGAIRTLYTACKHRGFVMISYYDIRAARTAMRSLQNKPLRRRKLDIHFSIPKDNPSDKDVNQGTLVVFNLDSSVSNDELRQIFGVYGEIKEIRETPHKKHHKFIEFYDVRAAEAALRALNRSDIAGKRIKLEPSRPGGARRSLMQQLTHELEQEEFRCQQLQNSLGGTSPGGHQWGPAAINKLGENGGPPLSPSSFGAKALNGVVGSLPTRVSSPLRNGIVANQSRHESLLQQGHLSLRLRQQAPSLLPDLDSPTFAPVDGAHPHLQRSLSAFDHSPRVLKNGQQHQHPWNSYYPGSPPVMYGADHAGPGHFPSMHSASFSERSYMDGHNAFLSDLSERWPGALRLNTNGGHLFGGGGSGHLIPTKGLVDSPRLGMSPQHRARSFPNGGIMDGFSDRGKTRRGDASVAQAENKKYQLDLERILRGEDTRTTLMIKNIPNKYTSKMLLSTIDELHRGTYDFIYLPIDFKNKCNVGYAFVNMIDPTHIVPFYQSINGKKWEKFNSEKVASLAYARIQGKNALVAHFQNSSLMNEDKRCRPILFHSEGPNLGDPEPFPVGSNVRTRPARNGVYQYEISSSSDSVSSCSSKDDDNGELDLGHCSDAEKD